MTQIGQRMTNNGFFSKNVAINIRFGYIFYSCERQIDLSRQAGNIMHQLQLFWNKKYIQGKSLIAQMDGMAEHPISG